MDHEEKAEYEEYLKDEFANARWQRFVDDFLTIHEGDTEPDPLKLEHQMLKFLQAEPGYMLRADDRHCRQPMDYACVWKFQNMVAWLQTMGVKRRDSKSKLENRITEWQ